MNAIRFAATTDVSTVRWTLETASADAAACTCDAAAAALQGASTLLARLAARMRTTTPATASAEPVVEFHAEPGTQGGVLYVDGLRVGVLFGVTRL